MSVSSWKRKFTPISAKAAAKRGRYEATRHALQRWIGFRSSNLDAHGLEWFAQDAETLTDKENLQAFRITSEHCALCIYDDAFPTKECASCPLYIVRGHVPCYMPTLYERRHPIAAYIQDGDPEPMIAWLNAAITLVRREEDK